MPLPFLNFLTSCTTGGKRETPKKRSCQLKIDQGEEEIKENQERICTPIYPREELICENLPEELIIESILTRLPVRTLAVCCCVSKSWYNSILHDSRFSAVHNIQNKNKVSLVFNLLNVSRAGFQTIYFFSLLGREKATVIRILLGLETQSTYETVGFCNGLACMKIIGLPTDSRGSIIFVNPHRGDSLVIPYVRPTEGYINLCHGFGFDWLSQVYKAVIVFASDTNNEFICMVITLGTISWRKIIISTFDISPPLGLSSLFPSQIKVSRTLCRQGTLCGGDLFWRIKNNDIHMLLSFDLHNDKIQFIRLPTECTLTITATTERQYLADDHLLEFKGYPCIARSERITITSNNDHSGHRCNYQTGACCCCYKIHMYILKDKDKQVWSKEETFDVQIMDQDGLLPTHPLCCYFDTSTTPTPPTRMLTFADQVLLYWFNGERLVFYNLREKHLKVVECSRSYHSVFRKKMNERLERTIGDDDDNIYCPSLDYQLHAQVENMMSLKTFIPKGAKTSVSDSADELMPLLVNRIAAGWLSTGRKLRTFYAFC